MRILIILLLFLSCTTEEVKKSCQKTCLTMTISDSIPIQFWINGVETYNEKQICGVYKACFCQPFECDDEITIQFQEQTGSDAELLVYDADDNELTSIEFDEVSQGVFQTSFVPSEQSPDICQKVRFVISVTTYDNFVDNSVFDGDAGWTNSNLGFADWSVVSDEATVTLSPFGSSEYYYQSYAGAAGNYRIRCKARMTDQAANDVSANVQVEFFSGGIGGSSIELSFVGALVSVGAESFDVIIPVTIAGSFDTFGLSIAQAGPGTDNGTFFIDYLYIEFIDTETATSDCIDLRESHDCTELLTYTNSTDFDGIDYETPSPAPTFYLRVPAQFWKENNPQEQEDSELSNGVIITRRQSIQEKTLLEIGYVPNYMHKKIQKVLMHETVMVGDMTVKKRDPYESENIDRYPLKRASVWLTKYDSVEKNTI